MVVACFLAAVPAWAAQQHLVKGILVQVKPARHLIVVSCKAVPGYMDAMVMPFAISPAEDIHALVPGEAVQFEMIEGEHGSFAEHLKVVPFANYESEPTEAARLSLLHRTMDPSAKLKIVTVGHAVPDFTLMDQAQQKTHLSQFKGKVVVLTFAYSRCPNPNYCFRLSNNLFMLERRFRSLTGSNLILMTIVIDPDNDRGKALERYASIWKADPKAWRFLTGSVAQIRGIAGFFGMDFWSDEGFLAHTFHTVVIDRDGKLAANLDGNQFTAEELGDLVQQVLHESPHRGTEVIAKEGNTL